MWAAPTASDVLSEFTEREKTTINSLKGTDDLAAILARVVLEIRGSIAAGGYALDVATTKIPESLFNEAIAISRWRFLISVPQFKQFQTEERKDAKDDALAKLKLVASKLFAPEPPDGTTEADLGGGMELIGDRPRLVTRETMSNI